MDPATITADIVHDALHAIRHAQPLDDSPLLGLDVLRVRLRAEGRADSRESRAWLLARYLDEVVREKLAALRGVRHDPRRRPLSPDRELALIEADFAAGSADLEAWSVVCMCFLSAAGLSVRGMAQRLQVSARTLARRSTRGCELLAEELRGREAVEPAAAQHNIPHPLTRFIGRESEIGEVRRLLARHRLVTLTGVGGIGKSRLAMELGRALAGDYADGAWLVELGAVEDEARVLSAVQTVFGVKEQRRRELINLLADFFEPKHLLLILDNCEHLTAASANLVQTLLGRCPDLQVLATSRERLRVAGECAWMVPPLSVPEHAAEGSPYEVGAGLRPSALVHYDAVRLFTDRARTAMPGFELTVDNAPHVARICSVLDGIPLATELAASRVNVLSPRDLAQRMEASFELLKDGHRPTWPQHETLWATMDWSFSHLEEQEQVLFRRAAVLRGYWRIDSAECVCVDERLGRGEVLELVARLLDKSLLEAQRRGPAVRYRMLDLVRRYAQEQLDRAGETRAIRDRHLQCFVDLAEEAEADLKGAEQAAWLAQLGAEIENLRSALRWTVDSPNAELGLRLSGALARFWELQGHFDEGRGWLAQCLAIPGADAATATRAKALSGAGALAEEQADYAAAEDYHRQSLAIRRALDDAAGVAESLNNLGNVANLRGDYAAARQLHGEALEIRRELGDKWGIAVSLNNLGNVAEYEADYTTARALYEESAAIAEALGDRWALSVALVNLGLVASDQGDLEAARGYLTASLRIADEMGDRQGRAYGLHTLGDVARKQGHLDEAWVLHAESLELATALGDRQGVAESLEAVAFLLAARNEPAPAVQAVAVANAIREAIQSPLTAAEEPAVRQLLAKLRGVLGDEEFERVWSVGRAMSEADVVGLLQEH